MRHKMQSHEQSLIDRVNAIVDSQLETLKQEFKQEQQKLKQQKAKQNAN